MMTIDIKILIIATVIVAYCCPGLPATTGLQGKRCQVVP